jgi:Protein of Unknown function (DUF2784)
MLTFLNVFFFAFHTAWMLFNCVGWIWKRTRPWHLATVLLTAASWFALGPWYGWGYCVCTDWHWRVREQLLGHGDPRSYTHMLFTELTGIDVESRTADVVTCGVFAVVAVLTVVLNRRDFLRRRAAGAKAAPEGRP